MNKTTLVRIKKEHHKNLKINAAKSNRTMSHIVNKLIEKYLSEQSNGSIKPIFVVVPKIKA